MAAAADLAGDRQAPAGSLRRGRGDATDQLLAWHSRTMWMGSTNPAAVPR